MERERKKEKIFFETFAMSVLTSFELSRTFDAV